MTHVTHPDDPRPGDLVRCTSVAGLPEDTRLTLGHIYTVREPEPFFTTRWCPPREDQTAEFNGPLVHLVEIPRGFAYFRFEKIATRAPLEDPIAARMAAVMREHEAQAGACTVDDLARAGFTSAQILEYADEARSLAGAPSNAEAA